MNPHAPKRILVTGASGAVGYATCEALAARGHHVAGTVRSRRGKNAEKLDALVALGVTLVEMDVQLIGMALRKNGRVVSTGCGAASPPRGAP